MKARMKKVSALLSVFLLLISLFTGSAGFVSAEAENRTVNVGFFAFPGYHEYRDGVYSGYGYSFLTLLQRYTHLNFELIGYGNSWEDMQTMLRSGEIDLVTSARKTPEREQLFAFSEPIGSSSARLSVRIDDERFTPGDYRALDGLTVGELEGNSRNTDLNVFAAVKNFTFTALMFSDTESLCQALREGTVDAILTSSLRKPMDEKIITEFAPDDFYVILRPEDTDLLAEINYGIAQMDANEGNWRDNLYYANYSAERDGQLSFTSRELEYIRAVQNGAKSITASVRVGADPYAYMENGSLKGIIPDYFAHLMEMAGLPYQTVIRTEGDLQDPSVNVMMDCRTDAADQTGLLTSPYMTLTASLVTRKNFTGPVRTVAVSENRETIPETEEGVQLLTVPTAEAAMKAVSEEKADACYVCTCTADKLMRLDPESKLQSTVQKGKDTALAFCVDTETDHELCSILNKCIIADGSGVLDGFIGKYTNVSYSDLTLFQYLRLHPEAWMLWLLLILALCFVIVVAVYRSRTVRQKNAQLAQEAEQQHQLAESLTFTNFFLDSYLAAYYVNLDTYACRIYKRTERMEREYPVIDNYMSSLRSYINRSVHPDDRAEMLELTDPERMRALLGQHAEYHCVYRDISGNKDRMYRMQVIRGADESHAAFGFTDITEELQEQKKWFLGAVPLSPNVLGKANIGLWAFELDEGKPPRMYVDDTMLALLGLTEQLSPEETYHAWYDHIDENAYGLVTKAVNKMTSGEHAEVQYPWQHPDGRTLIVRCGGILNPGYKNGIRIEGTHQDVSETVHYQSEGAKRDKDIIEILASEYSSVYYIDLDTDGLTPYTMNAETQSEFGQIFNSGITYSEAFRLYVDKLIWPEDKQMMLEAGSVNRIREALRNKKTYITAYRDSDNRYSEMKFVKVGGEHDAPAAVALGFADRDVQIREELAARQYSEIASALSQEYESIYYVNTDTDVYTHFHAAGSFATEHLSESGEDFFSECRMNLMAVTRREDRQIIMDYIDKKHLLKALENGPAILERYRLTFGDSSFYFAMRTVRPSASAPYIIIAVKNIHEEVLRKDREQAILKQNFEIIEILASEYSSVYYIDLTTDGLTPYTMNEETESEFGRIFRSGIRYSDAYGMYVDNLVYGEDKAMMLEAGSVSNILRELADKKTFITTYRSDNNGDPHWCEMKFVKVGDDENPQAVALGFADKDEELRREMEQKAIADRDAAVIAGLSDDFSCVLYVAFRNGEEVHYRFDPLFSENIAGWETMNDFDERCIVMAETVVHPDDADFFRTPEQSKVTVLNAIRREGVFYHNFRIVIDGTIRYYQLKIVRDEHSANHVIVGFRNVDETVKREMEYQEKLEAANKSKTDFLFNMSHDIRTPMNAIIGFTRLAEKHIDNPVRMQDCLRKIESSGNHLLDLINEVLDMSRVEAGKLHSEMKTVHVTDAAQRLVMICHENAMQHGLNLTFEEKNIVHPVVKADELHINQIVMNILGNAIKYTEPGGSVHYTVEEIVSEIAGYGKYVLTVEDTGIGMSKEFQEHIFDSFSREDNASTSRIQGTGLGMAIVKRLVDYMDGTISIDSEQGRGTKVTVILHLLLTEAEETEKNRDLQVPVSLKGKKVLLVEDNELNREIAVEILEEQGAMIDEACNGFEAVDAVRNHQPAYYDFVLMDIQMPRMDGYQATQEIRKLPGTENLPIIALSANAFDEDRRKSIAAGMNDHVAKPIVMEELMAALARFIR